MAALFVLVNLAVDLSYGAIDPRIRAEGGGR
jgi:ABC-type dipeptide/oligopeptide/nickel transport system permease component